jgi:hypothetical protein
MSDRPEWRTPTVVSLCKAMRAEKNYEAMPILADALEEAGFPDAKKLKKFRSRMDALNAQRDVCLIVGGELADAVHWMDGYVAKVCPYDVVGTGDEEMDRRYGLGGTIEDAYRAFVRRVVDEREIFYHGRDCHSSGDVKDAEDLYRNLSLITGEYITEESIQSFSCSC